MSKIKKLLSILTSLVMLFAFAIPTLAVKPASNSAGAVNVPWNLSGAVMPLPWGQHDIEGSDIASKLIVNRPNGNTEVSITGVMKGLAPNSTYQVYPTKEWTSHQQWDVSGTYVWEVLGTYFHNITITQDISGNFTGTGGWPAGGWPNEGNWLSLTVSGHVSGNTITFTVVYIGPYGAGQTFNMVGSIVDDGTISGISPWSWVFTGDTATKMNVGNGWPGLFNAQSMFTFTTDETGSGSWHLNIKNAVFSQADTYNLSIWVNQPGATILISDNFDIVVE